MTACDKSADNAGPPIIPRGTRGQHPIGFWSTIGWLGAAFAASVFFVFALVGSYDLIFGSLPNETRIIEDLTPCVCVIVILFLVEKVRRAGWSTKDYFAIARPTRRQMIVAFAAGVAFPFIDNLVGALDPEPPDTSVYIDYLKATAEGLVPLMWLNTIVVAAVAEETVFRGFLYRGWSRTRLNVSGTIGLTAILFGLLHFQYGWFGITSVTISGLILGWLRWWSGSLVAPILAHATNNVIVTIWISLLV